MAKGKQGKASAQKIHYKGIFQFKNAMDVMYGWAYSVDQMWAVFCRRLATKHNVPELHVIETFKKRGSNYTIKEEPKNES